MKKFILILLPLFLYAQNERDIKLSGNYYWGEGTHKSEVNAKNMALQDMMFKIQVTISSEVMTKEQQINDQYSEEAKSIVKATNTLSLQGVDFFIKTKRGNTVAIAYISKVDYQKSIEAISDEIRSKVTSLELDEKKGQKSIVEDYYTIYLRTFQCPEPINYTTLKGQQYPDIQIYLKNKVENWLANLTIETEKVAIDPSIPMITIPVIIKDRNQPANEIIARLNSDDGADMEVVDGNVQLFRYTLPSAYKEDYDVVLSINPDLKNRNGLQQLHENFQITQTKKINLDFTNLIKTGFNVYKQASGALLFKPVHTNLSISSLFWDFGDGESSEMQNPLHKYNDNGAHKVTLTFNNNPELVVSKEVNVDGKTQDMQHVENAKHPKEKWKPIFNSNIIKDLSESENYNNLAKKLGHYKKRRKIMYGKESDFVNPANCYIFIVHPQTKNIYAILNKGENQRQNLLTGENISDIGAKFRGMVSIYVEAYE